jgi:hypothetical protein
MSGFASIGGLDVVLREFWRTASSAARAPRGGKAAWVRCLHLQPGTTAAAGAIHPNITSTAIAP